MGAGRGGVVGSLLQAGVALTLTPGRKPSGSGDGWRGCVEPAGEGQEVEAALLL